jgi:hypothetical protein
LASQRKIDIRPRNLKLARHSAGNRPHAVRRVRHDYSKLIRRARHGDRAVLCAFDLIHLDGEDLRRAPIEHRKAKLARLVRVVTPRHHPQ